MAAWDGHLGDLDRTGEDQERDRNDKISATIAETIG
jgi:hypothetical protein